MGDFTVAEGHGHPLVIINRVNWTNFLKQDKKRWKEC